MEYLNELFEQEEELIEEPEYPFVEYNGIKVRLLNRHHSLWGELLTPASKILSDIIRDRKWGLDVRDKTIVELGAGAGLPSIVCSTSGAKNVVVTDFPDDRLIDNIRFNIQGRERLTALGFCWGTDPSQLLKANGGQKFDVALLCDVNFNVSEHRSLLSSIEKLLDENGVAVFIYTYHRTNKVAEDGRIFDIAQNEFNFEVNRVTSFRHDALFGGTEEDSHLRTTANLVYMKFRAHSFH